jgi:hypothetical protein
MSNQPERKPFPASPPPELRFFRASPAASEVVKQNFLDLVHKETDLTINAFLRLQSLEQRLVYWVNVEVALGKSEHPTYYWYPRDKAKKLVEETKLSPDYITYRLIREAMQNTNEAGHEDFRRLVELMFNPQKCTR